MHAFPASATTCKSRLQPYDDPLHNYFRHPQPYAERLQSYANRLHTYAHRPLGYRHRLHDYGTALHHYARRAQGYERPLHPRNRRLLTDKTASPSAPTAPHDCGTATAP